MKMRTNKEISDIAREAIREGLVKAVGGCDIQDGWPCRTCFFFTLSTMGVEGDEAHAAWLVQLRMRGTPDFTPGYTITTTPTPEQAAHEAKARAWRKETYGTDE